MIVFFYFEAYLLECSPQGNLLHLQNYNSNHSFTLVIYVTRRFSHSESILLISIFFSLLKVPYMQLTGTRLLPRFQANRPLSCAGLTCHCRDMLHSIMLSFCIPWQFIDTLQALVALCCASFHGPDERLQDPTTSAGIDSIISSSKQSLSYLND